MDDLTGRRVIHHPFRISVFSISYRISVNTLKHFSVNEYVHRLFTQFLPPQIPLDTFCDTGQHTRIVWPALHLVICPRWPFGSKGVTAFKNLHQEDELNEKMYSL